MEIAKLVLEFVKACAWPITVIFLGIYFRKSLKAILARITKASLPGGVELDFRDEIEQAQNLSEEILEAPTPKLAEKLAAPLAGSDVNKRLVDLGLEPVNSELNIAYFKELAKSDPTLALAGLRIEIEILTKNIIVGCNLPIRRNRPTTLLIRELGKNKTIDDSTTNLALQVIRICNQVIHGQTVDRDDAETVINSAAVLFKAFRDWLSTK
jgi:hypothetical protein